MLHRYRRHVAALLLIVAAFTVERAVAQALPVTAIAGMATVAAGTVVVGPWLGSAAAVAGTAVAGLTPVGWAALGVAVLAAVLITSDSDSKLVVSTRDSASDPNPDTAPVGTPSVVGYAIRGGSSNVTAEQAQSFVTLVTSTSSDAWTRSWLQLTREAARVRVAEEYACQGASKPSAGTCSGSNLGACYCQWPEASTNPNKYMSDMSAWRSAGSPGYTTQYGYVQYNGDVLTNTYYGNNYWRVISTYECPVNYSYSYAASGCIPTAPLLQDGVCNVTWDSITGCPVANPFDADCSKFNLQLSCGSASAPPSVKGTDPATGKVLEASRPTTSAQGNPGSVKLTETTPNPSNNTTEKRTTDLAPAAQPGQPPASAGSGQQTYPGTGAQVGTTPVSKVEITNWPNSPTASTATINFPERMKIDGEVPTESQAMPAPATDVPATTTFLNPVKDRLASFAAIELPPHESACPAIQFDVTAWGTHVAANNNFMCEQLEKPVNKNLLQGMIGFLYLLVAIRIVLGA